MHDSTSTLEVTRRFCIDELTTPIQIMIWRRDTDGWLYATASHAIHTPEQRDADVPQPSGYHQESVEAAFTSVMNAYTMEFEKAVERGHEKSESWLVPE